MVLNCFRRIKTGSRQHTRQQSLLWDERREDIPHGTVESWRCDISRDCYQSLCKKRNSTITLRQGTVGQSHKSFLQETAGPLAQDPKFSMRCIQDFHEARDAM